MKSGRSNPQSTIVNGLKSSRFRARVAKILFALLGLSAASASQAAAQQLAETRLEIEQRVLVARNVLQSGKRIQPGQDQAVEVNLPEKVAQWGNWPKWGNWGNWFNG